MSRPAVLVAMPWADLRTPSIQLGLLGSLARSHDYAIELRHAYVDFGQRLCQAFGASAALSFFDAVSSGYWRQGLGDWIFALPPLFEYTKSARTRYEDLLRGSGANNEFISKIATVKTVVPAFLNELAESIVTLDPCLVGFTTSYSQTVPSLALATSIKTIAPDVCIVFGGANCDGPMGQALLSAFSQIDYVVSGEGEAPLLELLSAAEQGRSPNLVGGLLGRGKCGRTAPPVLDRGFGGGPLLIPDYTEYFASLESTAVKPLINDEIQLPVEMSRGCWWGQKHHCTFCGLNGSSMAYRSASPTELVETLTALSRAHCRLKFAAVDNIIDMRLFETALPELVTRRKEGFDLELFFETKSNLNHQQVRQLSESGIRRIQPGIESLSTPILRLMKKGVTGMQNIRLLRLCAQYGVVPTWNIIYGFPGEPEVEYEKMAELVRSLVHLRPPALIPLSVNRFSPYHERPGDFGLHLLGPSKWYRLVYPDRVRVEDLAYDFEFAHSDGRDPENYVQPLRAALADWWSKFDHGSSLTIHRGPGFSRISDRREGLPFRDYVFGEVETAIIKLAEHGVKATSVLDRLPSEMQAELTLSDIESFLLELVECRIVAAVDGCFLSLAVPTNVA